MKLTQQKQSTISGTKHNSLSRKAILVLLHDDTLYKFTLIINIIIIISVNATEPQVRITLLGLSVSGSNTLSQILTPISCLSCCTYALIVSTHGRDIIYLFIMNFVQSTNIKRMNKKSSLYNNTPV